MSQNTLSIQLNESELEALKSTLLKNGWVEDFVNNEYVALRMKNEKGSVCTLYTSKKVVFQGNDNFTDLISIVRKTESVDISAHLGVDEVGKGDYFGPLVVVACFVDNSFLKKYDSLGIADSKKFTDNRIRDMYSVLKKYPYYYASVIKPEEYNTLYKEYKNVAILLAKQHSKVIEKGLVDLKENGIECNEVVIDQFSSKKSRVVDELGTLGKKVNFVQFHKGESDIAVACASILARGLFLEQMEEMNTEYYFNFPKGASNVISQGRDFVKKHGSEELVKVAKISFKTTKKVMQSSF